MDPRVDLGHRLSDHSVDEVPPHASHDAVSDVLDYAEIKGVTKAQLLSVLTDTQILEPADISSVSYAPERSSAEHALQAVKKSGISAHLSTTSVLFYIGGILLYVGIMIGVYQESDAKKSTGVALTLGIMGALFWVLAYLSLRSSKSDEDTLKTGLGDSALLVGSLFLFTCAGQSLFIIADKVSQTRSFLMLATAWFVALALMHFAFDRKVHRLLSISLAALSAIAAYYSFLWVLLLDAQNVTVYTAMVVLVGVYTFIIGSVLRKGEDDRKDIGKSFHSLGGLIVMGALYSLLVTGSHEMWWTLLYPSVLYGAFIYSIRSQSKTFLATGSIFLIVYVTTIIVKYFAEGLGPAVAFIVAAFAITGSAVFSLFLRKKYFNTNEK